MSSEIAQALKAARFNDLVHISVQESDDQKEAREIILKASLDKENGGIQWVPLPDDANLTKLHLSTKRWFFPMLNDTVRNQAYDEAIRMASEDVVRRFCPVDGSVMKGGVPNLESIRCLDIGSGTGLLAMLSANNLKKSLEGFPLEQPNIQIESLEMSSVMSNLAKKTVAVNQLDTSIRVSEKHSCEMEPLLPKAQFCTSELLESGLLAEGWLPAMRDAWKRHLDPKAIVVPQRARVWAQIVEGESLGKFWGPHQMLETGFVDNRVLKLWCTEGDNKKYLLQASGEMVGVQLEVHAKELLKSTKYPLMLLSDPIAILDIDVTSLEAMPPEGGHSKTGEFLPIASGTAHAVLFWWELDLYKGKVMYSTHHDETFQDHWQQCLFIFTKEQTALPSLVKGEPALLKGSHSESKVAFEVVSKSESHDQPESNEKVESKRLKTTPPETNSIISPDRAWQLNDLQRLETFQKGILFALNKIGSMIIDQQQQQAIALDLSDFSLGSIMASMLGCPLVYSVESSSNAIPITSAQMAQISNGLPHKKQNVNGSNDFQILQCHPEQITTEVLNGHRPNLVLAEPYYEILEGWHIPEALNYFYILLALRQRGVLQEPYYSVPARAVVMVCAFESQDIASAYQNCNDDHLCGLDHHAMNAASPLYDYNGIQIPSWQYDMRYLTPPTVVATIDYQNGTIVETKEDMQVPFDKSGNCHGILLWIDYQIALENEEYGVISTRGRGHQQIVQMLESPVTITPNQVLLANSNNNNNNSRVFLQCKSHLQKQGGEKNNNNNNNHHSFVDFEIIVKKDGVV